MDQTEIRRRRLASQGLARAWSADPAETVRRMGALQAQDYLSALWAVGVRTEGATERSVEEAIAAGRIVRTWPMRGTIHMLAPADVRWMLALLTPRVVQRTQGRLRELGIDAATLAAAEPVVIAALEGGKQLTRHVLFGALQAAGIATEGQRGIHILGQLAHAGRICIGPRAGKQPTFVLLDEWVPAAPPLARDEALATLALRFFTSHGPATIADLCWWSGLTVAEARAGLAAVEGQLASAECDGQRYYFDEAASAPGNPGQSLLLPPFDEYLIAYRDRGASLDPAYSARVVPGGNGIFNPITVLDGRVIGTWRRRLKPRQVVISFSPFEPGEDGGPGVFAREVERYSRFLGLPAMVEAGALQGGAGA